MENTTVERISSYSDEELEYFRNIIIEKRNESAQELEILNRALREEMANTTIKVTSSTHLGDIGTNTLEQEKIYMLLNRTRKFINYLDRALQRIENKTYGICKVTGKRISKGRLEAVPHTQLSIEAKRKQH